MENDRNLMDDARRYHWRLPERIRQYLNNRGIPNAAIDQYLLGWDNCRITIPIPDRNGRIACFKLAKDPADTSDSPKMLATPGARAELYGWENILSKPQRIIICEGEFDRLVLEARGFPAVTSTAGVGTFLQKWAVDLREIPRVCVCFDNDVAGQDGAARVAQLIPHARIVRLPREVGEGGDVTDLFVRLGKTRKEFEALLADARPLPRNENRRLQEIAPVHRTTVSDGSIDHIKRLVPIENIIAQYVPLRSSGERFIGRCPFHEDHHPSFVVYPETRSFYCFGCRVHGDVLSFLMRIERLAFAEACKVLQHL